MISNFFGLNNKKKNNKIGANKKKFTKKIYIFRTIRRD